MNVARQHIETMFGAAVLAGLIALSAALGEPDQGSLLHLIVRVVDAAIGGIVMVLFLALLFAFGRGLVAPHMDLAGETVRRLRQAQDSDTAVTAAEAQVASAVLIRSAVLILAVALGVICFGLWL